MDAKPRNATAWVQISEPLSRERLVRNRQEQLVFVPVIALSDCDRNNMLKF